MLNKVTLPSWIGNQEPRIPVGVGFGSRPSRIRIRNPRFRNDGEGAVVPGHPDPVVPGQKFQVTSRVLTCQRAPS